MVIDILRHRRKSKLTRVSDIWTAGKADDMHDSGAESVTYGAGRPGGCLALRRRHGWGVAPAPCSARYRFICQRAVRVCGSPAQQAGLSYAQAQPRVEGEVINVTCDDPARTSGHIRCSAHKWTRPHFCDVQLETTPVTMLESLPDSPMPKNKHYLGAIIGGVVGGAVVLAVLAVLLVCNARRRDDKLASEPYNFMEFWGLNHNPIYKSDEEEHVYSEVGGGEAIYEEPSFSASYRKPLPVEPPPLPGSHPSVSTMETDVTVSLAQDESDYEVFSTLDASKPIAKDLSATNSTARDSRAPSVCGDATHDEDEYSVPLVAGRLPAGHTENSSLERLPIDVGVVAAPHKGEPTPLGSEARRVPVHAAVRPQSGRGSGRRRGAQEHP
ncbi:uncharacterized protein LOC119096571 [Pollicipes pollicipes]|uniref:uncharacterized protein LOC119096571 n=1 Tax=Pollicipes pollicipes TaxID=41117 RepID=UPI0018857760|nr:uncharacterized protein LOC119096571 [Pollicipes pollicipes]